MSPRHVIVAALAVAALVAILVVPAERDDRNERIVPQWQRYRQASERLRIHVDLTSRAQSRAIAGAMHGQDDVMGARVAAASDVPTTDIALAQEAVREWWAREAPAAPTVGIAVALVSDSVYRALGIPPTTYGPNSWDLFVPGALSATTCHVVLRTSHTQVEDAVFSVDKQVQRALHSCRPYVRFGLPGRGVADWLASRQYGALHPGARPDPLDPPTNWRAPTASRACLGDRPGACAAMLLAPRSPYLVWNSTGPVDGWLGSRGPRHEDRTGAVVLHELERTLGTDGMRAVWTSDAAFDVTLERALGRPIGAAIVDWMPPPSWAEEGRTILGPLPRAGSCLATLLLALLAMAVGIWSYRRQVTAG